MVVSASSIVVLVMAAMALVLSGCGGSSTTTTTTAAPVGTTTTQAATTLAPTTTGPTTSLTTTTGAPACLCVFDVDRTLTGKQGAAGQCPDDKEQPGVHDSAYDGGNLVLSDLVQNLNKSFCARCYAGVVSAGSADGPKSKERDIILSLLGGQERTLSSDWLLYPKTSDAYTSSLILGYPDTLKQNAVTEIVGWFKKAKKIEIAASRVHFFDDRENNIAPFKSTGFNAHQVSCKSRDTHPNRPVGLCGGRAEEVTDTIGIATCTKEHAEAQSGVIV